MRERPVAYWMKLQKYGVKFEAKSVKHTEASLKCLIKETSGELIGLA